MSELFMQSRPPQVSPRRSWAKPATYLANRAEIQATHAPGNELQLENYVRTGVFVHTSLLTAKEETISKPARSPLLTSPLLITGRSRFTDACRAEQADEVQSSMAAAVLYNETASLLEYLVESEFPDKFGRKLRMYSIERAGWIGLAAGIGALEVVERWAPLVVQALQRDYVLAAKYEGMNHFILRLWCAARGRDYPQTGYPCYDVAEGVLRMWDTPDTETLGQWLVQLCNLHTKLTSSADFMDFANQFSHCPVEIMMLFRLREQRSLSNPEVDHPLMKFPWSRMRPVRFARPDDLLARVHRRLEHDESVTVAGLYEQFAAV